MTGYVTSVYSDAYAINLYSSFSIMGDQPDEKTKEFSKEELNVWNVEKLRKYLKYRGIVITGDTRKRDLISKVYYTLPSYICSTREQEQAQIAARRKEKLLIDGTSLSFPEDLAKWSTGSQYFPDTTMTDIETYLLKIHEF